MYNEISVYFVYISCIMSCFYKQWSSVYFVWNIYIYFVRAYSVCSSEYIMLEYCSKISINIFHILKKNILRLYSGRVVYLYRRIGRIRPLELFITHITMFSKEYLLQYWSIKPQNILCIPGNNNSALLIDVLVNNVQIRPHNSLCDMR